MPKAVQWHTAQNW